VRVELKLLTLLKEREETAHARLEELRVQPAVLHKQIECAEDGLSRLVITTETLGAVLAGRYSPGVMRRNRCSSRLLARGWFGRLVRAGGRPGDRGTCPPRVTGSCWRWRPARIRRLAVLYLMKRQILGGLLRRGDVVGLGQAAGAAAPGIGEAPQFGGEGGEGAVRDEGGVAAEPTTGLCNVCYVNAFQAQPDAVGWWRANHPDLLLRAGAGSPVMEDWNEALLDVSTPAKRERLAADVGEWIDGCASCGAGTVRGRPQVSGTPGPRHGQSLAGEYDDRVFDGPRGSVGALAWSMSTSRPSAARRRRPTPGIAI